MKSLAWFDQAACRGRNPDLWDEDAGPDAVAYGKAICAQCPVRDACTLDGLAEPHTVRGGLTASDRGTARNQPATKSVGGQHLADEVNERRQQLYDEGLDDRAIARSEGRSQSAIFEWRKRHGLPNNLGPHRMSDEELTERRAAYDEGLSDMEAADRIGISYNAFKGWRQRSNLPANGPVRIQSAEEIAKRRQLHEEGRTDLEIARLMGVTQNAIRGWRLRNGLAQNVARAEVSA